MSDNFQRGDLCPAVFQLSGGTAYTLNITGHNLDISSLLFDVTHAGHAGAGTARIAGKRDVSGQVKMDYDADRTPYALGLVDGYSGIMLFYVTPTRAIQIPVIIEKVNYQSASQGKVEFGCDVKMNILAGVLVYGTG